MIEFEYKTHIFRSHPSEEELDSFGSQGWELCAVDKDFYVFKKPIARKFRAVKVTDMRTGEVTHYEPLSKAAEALGCSATAIKYALNHHTLYFKRYKIEEDDNNQ